MRQHPYLNFNVSTYAKGKVVGTSSEKTYGNGLSKRDVRIVQIPLTFDNEEIVEIGWYSFRNTNVEYVFVSRNVRFINWGAFEKAPLREIRFEKGSKLENVNGAAFYNCHNLEKIDFPSSVKTIKSSSYKIFFQNTVLSCVSYHGAYDFSSVAMFENSPKIHVSSSYEYGKLGNVDVLKDDQTCNISNKPFYPFNGYKSQPIRYDYSLLLYVYIFLILS